MAFMCEKIFFIDSDQLPSGTDIASGDSKKDLDGFLLQTVQPQKLSVGLDPLVNIDTFQSGKIAGETQRKTAFLHIGNIETVSVEMNQDSELI